MKEDRTERLLALAKSFTKLVEERKDLDFRIAQWARRARAEFAGDEGFVSWCKSDLDLTDVKARELAIMARSAKLIPDARTWRDVGGSTGVRALALAAPQISKRDIVDVVTIAKTQDRTIANVLRDRLPPVPPRRAAEKKPSLFDAHRLAKFIVENAHHLPPMNLDIQTIVRMYVPTFVQPRAPSVKVHRRANA